MDGLGLEEAMKEGNEFIFPFSGKPKRTVCLTEKVLLMGGCILCCRRSQCSEANVSTSPAVEGASAPSFFSAEGAEATSFPAAEVADATF